MLLECFVGKGAAMYRLLIARMARRALTEAVAGRPGPALRAMASHVRLIFPGSSSLACDITGKDRVEAWLRRLAALRPTYEVLDIVVSGPPWKTRAAIRFRDTVEGYANAGMHYLTVRWGRITYDQVYLDTEVVAEWEHRRAEPVPPVHAQPPTE